MHHAVKPLTPFVAVANCESDNPAKIARIHARRRRSLPFCQKSKSAAGWVEQSGSPAPTNDKETDICTRIISVTYRYADRHRTCDETRRKGGEALMKTLVVLILMAVVLIGVTPLIAADTAAGKDLYGKKCASCHGANGEGKEAIAKMFNVEMKPLTSKDVLSKTDADLKKVMLEGSGKMKAVKDLDAKGADDIVAYMRSLAKK
jgi:mono/diheme cytochrome c family protein